MAVEDGGPVELPMPNLFVVGAAKAGTTYLHHALDTHPQIAMSRVKEPHYFAELGPAAGAPFPTQRVDRREDYLALFGDAEVRGEASPSYLFDPGAAARIRAAAPDARIVILLRDPIHRAHSHYLMDVRDGIQRRSFADALERDATIEDRRYGSRAYLYEDLGLYADQVARYLEQFPREHILIAESSAVRDPGFPARVHALVGVEPRMLTDDGSIKANAYARPRGRLAQRIMASRTIHAMARGAVPEWARHGFRDRVLLAHGPKPDVPAAVARRLLDRYHDDVGRTRQLTGLELPGLTSHPAWTTH